ncbi:MAG: outer membrane lipid asymmetry maintenance protein MlaD [Gammaproteobacteria bacterium]
MPRNSLEFSVGAFVLLGAASLAWLALQLGDLRLRGDSRPQYSARFASASGLREGAHVEIAGVRKGVVSRVTFDPVTYEAVVELRVDPDVRLQADTIASIRTAGLIGDRFVKLSPGGDVEILPDGGELTETEPAISLEELLGKYIFDSGVQRDVSAP